MSHPEQRKFVELVSSNMGQYFKNCKVLEIGSLDINGSVKDYFTDCDYIGIDVAEGKNVDLVCQGQDYGGPDNIFDQVISCEAMEHNPYWVETIKNMVRVCKPGGLVLMTCATTGRCEHGTTKTQPYDSPLSVGLGWDYYKNLQSKDFESKLDLEENFAQFHFWINWRSFDVYFCGIKQGAEKSPALGWDVMIANVDSYTSQVNSRPVCIYRALLASLFGDGGFNLIRQISDSLNLKTISYIHGK